MVYCVYSGYQSISTKGVSMKGYKVVNYDKWVSLPEIFSSPREAKEAKSKWHLGGQAVIESFNSKSPKAKIIKDRE